MSAENNKLGIFPFVFGGLSFIPGIGILIGIAAIAWGLATKREGGKKLAIVGGCGIGFSIILYSTLFYFAFVQRGGVYDGLRTRMAESSLISLVQAIEFYKIQNGHYPDTLETLKNSLPKDSLVFVFDSSNTQLNSKPHYFYYELVDSDHYYLLGVGPDGKPFTNDDILPKIDVGSNSHVGLLLKNK